MPWKGEKDPYKIWLSEIILQQTRVEQGWAYYEKFLKNFPTIFQLAAAKDEKVFKLWEGLGYYNRCKNLLFTARHIVKEFKGKFPKRKQVSIIKPSWILAPPFANPWQLNVLAVSCKKNVKPLPKTK